jgi:hypothetical protein
MTRRGAVTFLLFSLVWIGVGSCALAVGPGGTGGEVLAIVCIVVGVSGVAAVLAVALAYLPRNTR